MIRLTMKRAPPIVMIQMAAVGAVLQVVESPMSSLLVQRQCQRTIRVLMILHQWHRHRRRCRRRLGHLVADTDTAGTQMSGISTMASFASP